MSNRYEFLGSTAIGQYIPQESFFHRRDPRARLLAYFALFLGISFTTSFYGLGIGFICILLTYIIAQIPIKPALKGIKRALPFLIILAMLQIVFSVQIDSDLILWHIFGIAITQRAMLSSAMLIAKFSVLILLLNGFTMTLSTAQITAALFYILKPIEKLKFPLNDVTMVVQITLRYLPLIAQAAEKIAKAQAARGGDWEQRGFNPVRQAKRVLPLIVPLMVTSLKRAETMALAMESRGFNAAEKRSSFYALSFTWVDGIFLVVSIAVSVLLNLSIL